MCRGCFVRMERLAGGRELGGTIQDTWVGCDLPTLEMRELRQLEPQTGSVLCLWQESHDQKMGQRGAAGVGRPGWVSVWLSVLAESAAARTPEREPQRELGGLCRPSQEVPGCHGDPPGWTAWGCGVPQPLPISGTLLRGFYPRSPIPPVFI